MANNIRAIRKLHLILNALQPSEVAVVVFTVVVIAVLAVMAKSSGEVEDFEFDSQINSAGFKSTESVGHRARLIQCSLLAKADGGPLRSASFEDIRILITKCIDNYIVTALLKGYQILHVLFRQLLSFCSVESLSEFAPPAFNFQAERWVWVCQIWDRDPRIRVI